MIDLTQSRVGPESVERWLLGRSAVRAMVRPVADPPLPLGCNRIGSGSDHESDARSRLCCLMRSQRSPSFSTLWPQAARPRDDTPSVHSMCGRAGHRHGAHAKQALLLLEARSGHASSAFGGKTALEIARLLGHTAIAAVLAEPPESWGKECNETLHHAPPPRGEQSPPGG